MKDHIMFPSSQKARFLPAYVGDGVCLAHIGHVHTTVMSQCAFALTTGKGGDCGVVVWDRK